MTAVSAPVFREAFEYRFSRLDPMSEHIDPPSTAVYETLLVKGCQGETRPGLASVVAVSDSGLEWTLRLRDGVRFHSGAPCDAATVVECLERLRWQGPGSRQLWYWDPVAAVAAVDARTLRFSLHHPYPRLPTLLWGTHTAVFNSSMQRRHPDDFGSSVWDGTGAFRVEDFDVRRVRATRHRPGAAAPVPDAVERVEWVSLPDREDRTAALLAGEVDCAHALGPDDLLTLRGDGRFTVYEDVQPSNMYLSLDWRRRDLGFDDVRTRRALSLAIDRVALVEQALHGHGRPTWGPLPPGTEFYDASVDLAGRHDSELARAQLHSLGWRAGEDGVLCRGQARLAFECVVQRDAVFERVAELVAGQLRAVGVELVLRPVQPFADFYQACADGHAGSISKWLWQDPMEALIGFCSSSTAPFPNWSHASVPVLDGLFERFRRATTGFQLAEVASAVQEVFAAELPYLPLLTPNDDWVSTRRVRGFAPSRHVLYPRYEPVAVEP